MSALTDMVDQLDNLPDDGRRLTACRWWQFRQRRQLRRIIKDLRHRRGHR